ncbi:MAG TPA: DNA polymerase/3'-5' exonuclease PolX [Candidatus Eisenbacteria bacterium]|nr:DNA polymerase/3'-5' exonuclease PolX [Candidatus Eisenbacteria bacterium]
MTNAEVARAFSRLATMLEIDGANPFRVRAYREAARVVENLGGPVAALAGEPGRLEELPGIGRDLAQKIRDLATTGSTPAYAEMRAKIPDAVVDFTELQGLGPKRVKTLFETLGIRDREALAAAAAAGRLRDLPGFGEKVEQNVLKALATAAQWSGRVLLAHAWPLAQALADRVRSLPGVAQVELAGSFRRRRETIGDLDVLVSGGDPAGVMQAFVTHESVADVLGRGDTKSSVRLATGLQVDLRLVPAESFGAALLYFTGSKEHNIELRRIAQERGMSLNEYGLTRGERTLAARTEADVYRALGLAWIPPELREARGEIEWARDRTLPRLVELEDLRADLHLHTDRTDGRDSLAAMVRAAAGRGYEYVAITDHSQAMAMSGGFDAARVAKSAEEIAAVRREVPGIRVLHGLEVDILADGALDLDDATLASLDWVIVSLHSRLDMPAAAATARVLRALANPHVHAFGHPTGRLLGSRGPVAFDVERVVAEAAARGVALEINASPERLDLNDVNARLARARGGRFVISTDAHSVTQLESLRFGVFQARRAALTREDVLNALPYAAFEQAVRRGSRVAAAAPAAGAAAMPTAVAKPVAEAKPVAPAKPVAAAKPVATAKPAPTAKLVAAPKPADTAKRAAARKPARAAKPATAKAGSAAGRAAVRRAKPARPGSRSRKG